MPLIPPLNVPPRPPELPIVPPPVGPGQPETFKRNDAFLAVWIEEFERVMKDAWVKLNALLEVFDARIKVLETRIADTYTFGQKGTLPAAQEPTEPEAEPEANLLALPLRVVRDEEIMELTAACEIPSIGVPAILTVQHRGGADVEVPWEPVGSLVLDVDVLFVELILSAPWKLKRNDVLRVLIEDPGEDVADVVVQIRCR
jgi:hypothetical protein